MSRENTLALVRYRLDQADDAVRAASEHLATGGNLCLASKNTPLPCAG
jgi:hypothetical protein